jgi:tRNA(fMet)-specific endonuclease VapC
MAFLLDSNIVSDLALHPKGRVADRIAPVDVVYGRLRATLERTGRPIGANDLFIAAHALTLQHTLVSANEREFSRIEGLSVENWLR